MTTDANAGAGATGTAGAGDAGAAGAGAGVGTAGAGGTGAAPWYGTELANDPIVKQHIGDKFENLDAYVKNKGWKGGGDVLKSYLGVQGLLGRDPSTLIPLPRADDPAGYRSVLAKLGLPETPDKYEFAPAPGGEKLDEGYEKWARDAFHKAGLTAAQVKALTAEQNAYAASRATKAIEDARVAHEADKQALMSEWRGGYERMVNAAKTAAQSLGYTEEMIDAMEGAVGYAATMKFFASLGQKLGEDGFVRSGDGQAPKFAGTLTPAEAKAQWEAMKLDPVAVAALGDPAHPGHKAQSEKKHNLFRIMYPQS